MQHFCAAQLLERIPRSMKLVPAFGLATSAKKEERDALDASRFLSRFTGVGALYACTLVHGYGVGVAVLVGVRETSTPLVWSPMTMTRPLRKPRMVLA
jgi:hypothetical protein